MRIFLISSTIPDPERQASHIVLNATIQEMMRQGHVVVYQRILRDRASESAADQKQLERLTNSGVEVLPLLLPAASTDPKRKGLMRRLKKYVLTQPEDLYPEICLKDELECRVKSVGADILFVFWNPEGLAASFQIRSVPKFVYYGMPDHAAGEARFKNPELFDIPCRSVAEKIRLAAHRWENKKRLNFHLRFMRDCRAISNLSAFHAEFYRQMGHANSLYIPNMWPDTARGRWGTSPESEKGRPFKILASVGRPFSTGNTFGLHALGTQILPLLRKKLGAGNFELHICGRGQPYSSVAKSLQGDEVKWRGWVPDIDKEIRSSHLFLIANNTGFYKGVHTRFLHAWSLGACVVAHTVNTRYMPEIRHERNTLLGGTPEEISDWVTKALYDPHLRKRIGEGGRRTYEEIFTPAAVVSKLLKELQRCAGSPLPAPTPAPEKERSYQPQ